MPYLYRNPKPQRDAKTPTVFRPLLLIAYMVFAAGCFTHGQASTILFLSSFTVFTGHYITGEPRIVFPKKSAAQNRPHP